MPRDGLSTTRARSRLLGSLPLTIAEIPPERRATRKFGCVFRDSYRQTPFTTLIFGQITRNGVPGCLADLSGLISRRRDRITSGLLIPRSASSALLRGVAIATNVLIRSESLRVAFHYDEFVQVYH